MKLTFSLRSDEMVRTAIARTLVFASKLESKISVNFDNSNISIDLPNDANLEIFIDFIFDNFEISKIDIENGEFVVPTETTHPTVTTSKSATTLGCIPEIDLDTDDDSEEIESLLSSLSKSLNWLIKNKNIRAKTIAAYILTLRTELQLNFANENPVEFDVGNIVEIYYGIHMSDEMQGIAATGIVVEKLDNLTFIVPLGGFKQNEVNFELVKDKDFRYFYDFSFTSTYASLSRGQFINENRVTKILGNLSSEALTSLKNSLPNAFNFVSETSSNNEIATGSTDIARFNQFVSTHDCFTTKDLYKVFENVNKNTICGWIYSAKKKGRIISEKRGEYKVNN